MKSKKFIFYLWICLSVTCYSQKEVTGEVFIVTKGGNSVKLGLVNVFFLTQRQYEEARNIISPEYRILVDRYNEDDSLKHYAELMAHSKNVHKIEQDFRDFSQREDSFPEDKREEYAKRADSARAVAKRLEDFATKYIRHFTDSRADDIVIGTDFKGLAKGV